MYALLDRETACEEKRECVGSPRDRIIGRSACVITNRDWDYTDSIGQLGVSVRIRPCRFLVDGHDRIEAAHRPSLNLSIRRASHYSAPSAHRQSWIPVECEDEPGNIMPPHERPSIVGSMEMQNVDLGEALRIRPPQEGPLKSNGRWHVRRGNGANPSACKLLCRAI